jgi:hypothetical protein
MAKLIRVEDNNANDAEAYFSRLHLFIPAQRKNLPMHMLQGKEYNQPQDRRKRSSQN